MAEPNGPDIPPVRIHPSTPPAPRVPRRLERQPSLPELDRPLSRELAEIEQYRLTKVSRTHRLLGQGAYGTVEELEVDGVRCAGKKIHDLLINGAQTVPRTKFVEECKTMSKLRHPHIVQFLGVWQDNCSAFTRLPVLVMEYLQFDLHNVLLNYRSIPISMKVSILFDVTKGLRYLHSHNYAHRDLTACNVLLNSALVAKITDFGMTRLVDLSPMEMQRLTNAPGNVLYMPPEAALGTASLASYTKKMDIFSFGVLALFTVTQRFPSTMPPATYAQNGVTMGRSEVERRQDYFETARLILADPAMPEHRLLRLMENCLQHEPNRPQIGNVFEEMAWISHNMEDEYGGLNKLDFIQRLSACGGGAVGAGREEDRQRLEEAGRREEEMRRHLEEAERREEWMQRQLEEGEVREEGLRGEKAMVERDLEELRSQWATFQRQMLAEIEFKNKYIDELERRLGGDQDSTAILNQTRRELERVQGSYEAARAQVDQLCMEREALDREWSRRLQEAQEEAQHTLEEEVRAALSRAEQAEEQLSVITAEEQGLREKLEAATRRLDEVSEALRRKEEEVTMLMAQRANGVVISQSVGRAPQSSGLRVSLPIVWNENCPPLPFGIRRAQTVTHGSKVVIGGGDADGDLARRVLVYDSDRQRWYNLGYYSHRHFAIALMKRQILLIGGFDEVSGEYTGRVSEWDQSSRFWRKVYLPMPTPRGEATAVTYNSYLVVVGGFDGSGALSTVELLDCDSVSLEWQTVAPLPEACLSPQPVLCQEGEILYVLGKGSGLKDRKLAFSTSLSQLVQSFVGAVGVWSQLTEPPLSCSGAVALRGYLLAVGGKDKQSQKKMTVYMYLPGTGEWLCVTELPYPQHSCTCASLSDERFLVIGGVERANRLILASASSLPNH